MAETSNSVLDNDYIEALREKYREERDRRIRPEGEEQYLAVSGKYAEFVDTDPFTPVTPREPLHDEVEIAIVGGGWSGLVTAARLVEAGATGIRLIDDAADFGGTWYWNRYPGIQCDIESYSYLPLLEETGYIPKEKYSYGSEIAEHARRIGELYGLYDKVVFQTRVIECRWDDKAKRWILRTNRGDEMRSRFVVLGSGLASRPKLPGIPGFDDFEGKVFHTCRWDYDYTGGDVNGGMAKLADKRVAIIGTGATAIQCVPFVGESAEKLYVFQRTPSSVDLRGNAPTDPDFFKTLEPGWQDKRRENFNNVLMGVPVEEDLVNDRWTVRRRLVERMMAQGKVPDMQSLMREADLEDFAHMEEIRRRCDEVVENPETAELLKPYYQRFCKRPTFNDQYLATFNRPNVELVDTSWSHGVERITKNGLVANGKEYEVDCIVLATGFEMSTGFKRRIGVEVAGRGGVSLYDHWSEGMRTMHGHSIHGFPNFFFVGLSQIGVGPNFTSMIDGVCHTVSHIIAEAQKRDLEEVEVTAEAEQAWIETIRAGTPAVSPLEQCTPGYFNNEGQASKTVSNYTSMLYAPGCNAFNALLAEWRANGEFAGFQFRRSNDQGGQ